MSTILSAAPANLADPNRPALEVADVFRRYGPSYRVRHVLSRQQRRAMRAIEACRTAALGGHVEECDRCGHRRPVYNSCRNRHCPKCQALAKAQWLAQRQAELLPVGYFHAVFTLPHELNPLLAANQAVLYTLLFRSVAATLQSFAADPQYGLGGQLGFTAVLHTWDQKLLYHVHLHCVIAGGCAGPPTFARMFVQWFLPKIRDEPAPRPAKRASESPRGSMSERCQAARLMVTRGR